MPELMAIVISNAWPHLSALMPHVQKMRQGSRLGTLMAIHHGKALSASSVELDLEADAHVQHSCRGVSENMLG